jgi:hypothetical protein
LYALQNYKDMLEKYHRVAPVWDFHGCYLVDLLTRALISWQFIKIVALRFQEDWIGCCYVPLTTCMKLTCWINVPYEISEIDEHSLTVRFQKHGNTNNMLGFALFVFFT